MNEIEPGSPVHRVATMLRAEPRSMLTRNAIANKLNMTARQVDAFLEPGLMAGWLVAGNDADFGKVYYLGPKAPGGPATASAAPVTDAPAAPAASSKPLAAQAPEAARPQATTTRRGRAHLPSLDLGALVVSAAVPLPMPAVALRGQTKHDAVFDSLTADGMSVTGIPIAYQAALLKATQAYLIHHPDLKATSKLFVRRIDERTCGIWRVPKATEEPLAQQRARKAGKLQAA